ncbi:hypothetical protein [Haliscomenobacter hydrossis]|uniref:DUF4123 domain-containing protein n=1 Tax=Haliscomenobacter hydrossis (strain ATCC 27775 / DSM 1100 / LMG 10767 / O) TaxID=760192 RepID=F4L614_HALH1|nr:hypothetical protein [Haliscomenobacter hydrossis]AEE53074.1 hypothetical protein Halhy_5248 [Haliscomenobacter hydrossis DSM 1100]
MKQEKEYFSPSDQKKILIINWKWELDKDWVHINANSLKKHPAFLEDLDLGRGRFFAEFSVQPSDYCPNALVVATSIYNDGDATQQLLFKLLDQYVQPKQQVLLLMHRPNAYHEEDLRKILAQYSKNVSLRCILFEGGRNYLYYPVQKSGLLDDAGNFYMEGDISVFDEAQQRVLQPYFDRVWKYYEGEFESKVLMFKEDLLDCLFPLFLQDNQDIIRSRLIQVLQADQEKLLWIRLKSFVGTYLDVSQSIDAEDFDLENQLKKEQKTLAHFERHTLISYGFEECIVNLERNPHALEAQFYHETRDFCQDLFFGPPEENIPKSRLRELAGKFDLLIKVIPGMIS